MMTEISTKKARGELSSLLKRVEKGEEVIISRRGKQVARIVPLQTGPKHLPSLKKFRDGIRLRGEPLSQTVVRARTEERY
jgi:prevent-host-death family protein